MSKSDGTLLALFENIYRLQRLQGDHPEWTLDTIVVQ